ncbi:DUF6119 family protein [Streptomyces lydicus]|uniref:DUF6119 family protein n=1 Tax=Streptomyces lydicus TaxID=47763 RepID=UPI0036F9C541
MPPSGPRCPGSTVYVCLDRRLIKTAQHPHSFEAADLLAEDGTLIHVKRDASSAPLSHLFAQGRVSAGALRFDAEARTEFFRRVREQHPGHPVGEDFTPREVVYAILAQERQDPDDEEPVHLRPGVPASGGPRTARSGRRGGGRQPSDRQYGL